MKHLHPFFLHKRKRKLPLITFFHHNESCHRPPRIPRRVQKRERQGNENEVGREGRWKCLQEMAKDESAQKKVKEETTRKNRF